MWGGAVVVLRGGDYGEVGTMWRIYSCGGESVSERGSRPTFDYVLSSIYSGGVKMTDAHTILPFTLSRGFSVQTFDVLVSASTGDSCVSLQSAQTWPFVTNICNNLHNVVGRILSTPTSNSCLLIKTPPLPGRRSREISIFTSFFHLLSVTCYNKSRVSVNSLQFSPSGRRLFVGNNNGEVSLWAINNGCNFEIVQQSHTANVRFVHCDHVNNSEEVLFTGDQVGEVDHRSKTLPNLFVPLPLVNNL